MGKEKNSEANQDDSKPPIKNDSGAGVAGSSFWILEEKYPAIENLLKPSEKVLASDTDAIVVLDTNVLLLPFRLGKQELSKLRDAYQKLIADKKLYVPERALREYLDNRDRRLLDLAKSFLDQTSKLNQVDSEIAPLLEDLGETAAFREASKKFQDARKEYLKASTAIANRIKDWRGDDPVSSVYNSLFTKEVIIGLTEERKQIEDEWSRRLKNKIPPGYKDGAKTDAGIGDYLIWRTILELGKLHKKNLIFVTGEEKADWWVRSDGEGVYPRPELIDEYRRASNGRHLRLSKLADVLADLQAPSPIVTEVREAETAANTAAQISQVIDLNPINFQPEKDLRKFWFFRAAFNHSENDGICTIERRGTRFDLKFSHATASSVYLHQTQNTPLVASANGYAAGSRIPLQSLDFSVETLRLETGDRFVALNLDGFVLAGRVTKAISDESDTSRNLIEFTYRIFESGRTVSVT